MIKWTLEDSNAATAQGWCVFSTIGSIHGTHQLQRIDEPEEGDTIFDTDERAWESVYEQFLLGNKLAAKAFYFLSENCMEEFQRIKEHCESTLNGTLYNSM